MRLFSFLFLALILCNFIAAQTSLDEIGLKNGKYAVGFRYYKIYDSTRTYNRIYDYTNKHVARPIPVSIWYPSKTNVSSKAPIKILDYFEILKKEEEWEHLPNEQLLNWFYYANTPENRKHLNENTTAFQNAEFFDGKYPVVVYAPSYQASSIENFTLCEFLASHGYIVISSPSRGTETRWFSKNNAKEMETQARDVEFLIKEVSKLPIADDGKIVLMGFSFGGLANIIVQNRNEKISAIISLDGTERYQYQLLEKSPFFDSKKLNVPYLHMAQKKIPDNVLKEDNIDPQLNTKFNLFDSISKSDAYKMKFHNLTHSHFSTLGVLFSNRDTRQDKSDMAIMESYKLMVEYALNFLNTHLKNDEKAMYGLEDDLISLVRKDAEKSIPTFQDFNEMALAQDYQKLNELYDSILEKHPSFNIPEGNLNTLGLQLVFNPKAPIKGIRVLLFATKLHPNSSNLYDSLAEGYLFLEKKEMAIENFKKSLKLNAKNQNATNRLKQLEE